MLTDQLRCLVVVIVLDPLPCRGGQGADPEDTRGAQERHAEKEKAGDRIIDTNNLSLSKLDRFITLHGFGDGFLDWQSFHTGGAIKAVDAFGVMQNIFGVLRFRNRASVA